MEFSQTSPCVLSRSLLQLMFLPPNKKVFGVHNMTDMLRDTVRTFIAPPALMPKYVHLLSAHVVCKLAHFVKNNIYILGHVAPYQTKHSYLKKNGKKPVY